MIIRLGILASHPIQYHSPWFRHLAGRMDLQVFYAHRQNAAAQGEAGFGVGFEWDVDLLDGYSHRFLTNVSRRPDVDSFFGCDTPELYDLLRQERFDAFLVFGWSRKSALQAVRACRRQRVPVLMRGDSQLRTPRPRRARILKSLPFRWFLPRLDGHLYVGERNREYLRHFGVPPERLFFTPHCVDNDFFGRGASRAACNGNAKQLRDALRIPENAFVVLFVGKMIAEKRIEDFLRALARAARSPEGRELHAVLVGDGPLRPALERMPEAERDRAHFLGFRNQSGLPLVYQAANALVLPSASETWGLVVNEAFACGIPAIVSDAVGCAPDLIEEGRTGFTFPVGDVGALAARMIEMERIWRTEPDRVREAVAEKADAYSIEAATRGLEKALDVVATRRGAEATSWLG